jgi:hypothetical protein
MGNFTPFGTAVAKHFAAMSNRELFRVNISGDDLWAAYLAAFPEGTNPIFRTRTEHDGSYDKGFVRQVGNVVDINNDGSLNTIWDVPAEYPYSVVAEKLAELVRAASVTSLFRHNERKVGHDPNIEMKEGKTIQWTHFRADITDKHYTRDVGTIVGEAFTTIALMQRGFEEIKPEAVTMVLDLIEEGTLYRGAEFKTALEQFQMLQQKYLALHLQGYAVDRLLWPNLRSPVARLRNTVIGTLLQDLSEGKELEFAVKSYETKVAPTNYKRPTALITKSMIADATKTITDLGLEPALERRFAKISDVTINNVLWVDNQVKSQMKGGIGGLLMQEIKEKPTEGKNLVQIGIEDFMSKVLPQALSMQMFFSNTLQSNLMSLTAPVNQDVQPIFKWDNNFAWSYNGNITDSIKEKVKAAGGNVQAKLRVSLAWFNHDDLDLHAQCPEGHVYYGAKSGGGGRNGQILDVDMNAGSGQTRTPVENLSWRDPMNGTYIIKVHQFCKRETSNVGFTIEMEHSGKVTQYSYHKAVTDRSFVSVMTFTVKNGDVVDVKIDNKNIVGQGISQTKWNIPTEQFVKVNTVMLSPNYWDDRAVGNKHWFFILDNCLNDEPTRGIYNEFLKPELDKHRKVFEVFGNKTKCLPSTAQLSGLGFSSTKRDSVIVKVTDSKTTRTYQVQF